MVKILFVCHGNICRSPMAESVFWYLAQQKGMCDKISVASAATSTEEIGNPVHAGTRQKLQQENIPVLPHRAVQLKRADYAKYEYLIGMDSHNLQNMQKICGKDTAHKCYRLLDFTENPRDIADPWYTGNFDATYADIVEGCTALLEKISCIISEKGQAFS